MRKERITKQQIEAILQPRTDLEKYILAQPALRKGLLWGEPRYGHPEGMVLNHIPEIFHNIENLMPAITPETVAKLRILALIHDSFKYAEDKSTPRDWSKHHGILARQFATPFLEDTELLEILELHDEAYYCWRSVCLQFRVEEGERRWQWLMQRIEPYLQLYYLFFKCDTRTGDKTQAPVKWVEQRLKGKTGYYESLFISQ